MDRSRFDMPPRRREHHSKNEKPPMNGDERRCRVRRSVVPDLTHSKRQL